MGFLDASLSLSANRQDIQMNLNRWIVLLSVAAALTAHASAPPFSGTVFLHSDVITAEDPTSFTRLRPVGTDVRHMFDRRINAFADFQVHVFEADYWDGATIEALVNIEFEYDNAESVADFYAEVVGRLPAGLRTGVDELWIHQGNQFFGGGNRSLLIHTGTIAQSYIHGGILEEVLMHEAVHSSLDSAFRQHPAWLNAQAQDGKFISSYAQDFPVREDLAESFNTWFIVRHRADRVSASLVNTIEQTIPARLAFFDSLDADLEPVAQVVHPPELMLALQGSWFNQERSGEGFVLDFFTNEHGDGIIVYFYTYDLDHRPLYMVGSALLPSSFPDSVTVEVVHTQGTRFGPEFDPAEVELIVWGELTIQFYDCDHGQIRWEPVLPGYLPGETDIQRLASRLSAAACP